MSRKIPLVAFPAEMLSKSVERHLDAIHLFPTSYNLAVMQTTLA